MKINNHTHWHTDHLKAILQRAAEQELDTAKRKVLVVDVVYSRRHGSSSGCAVLGGRHMTVRIPKGPRECEPPVACEEPSYVTAFADYREKFAGRFWIKWPTYRSHQSFTTEAARDAWLAELREKRAKDEHDGVWLRGVKLAFAHTACHEMAHIRGLNHREMSRSYRWDEGWKQYVGWAEDMPLEVQEKNVKTRPTVDDKLEHVRAMRARAETRAKRALTILKKWKQRERYYMKAASKPRKDEV